MWTTKANETSKKGAMKMATKKKVELTEKMQGKIEKWIKDFGTVEQSEFFDTHDLNNWMDSAVNLLKEVVGYEDEDEED